MNAKTTKPDTESKSLVRAFFGKSLTQRQFTDAMSRGLVTAGGWIIILSILAILFVIIAEIYPLFIKST